ncbi:hypothetical protein TNCV_286761 [Trichonephila clavipes]|nr:hypothetical protein TNCV_286761 [Trichonephila clavipes]
MRGHGILVVNVLDRGWRVKSSYRVPLKIRHVGERFTLNLLRAQMSSRWCGILLCASFEIQLTVSRIWNRWFEDGSTERSAESQVVQLLLRSARSPSFVNRKRLVYSCRVTGSSPYGTHYG